ncbi:MAG: GTPase ObgE [Bacillota bacterium]|nr:GTPase ObgE [Bacillota bacterium]
MFIDRATIWVKGGDGGNGAAHFRREKYIPAGGPDGGDGGRGGNVEAEVDSGLGTLLDFRYRSRYRAPDGGNGAGKGQSGRDGEDLVLRVPPGTLIRDARTGEVLADLVHPGQRAILAFGGRGGRGNAHFATPTRRAPKFAEQGEPGEERELELELKLLADVGLVGLPNAGKSTLIARLSAARPKIADYPFTTLVPNLGVVRVGEGQSFVVADLPGLIAGASAGAGLGLEFLRHVERTRVLVHVLDLATVEPGRDPVSDWQVINRELAAYRPELLERPQLVAANKVDVTGARERLAAARPFFAERGLRVFPISAATGEGLEDLVGALAALVLPAKAAEAEAHRTRPPGTVEYVGRTERPHRPDGPLSAIRQDGAWMVSGQGLERLVQKTDLANEAAVKHLQRIFREKGLDEFLLSAGVRPGELVRIAGKEFYFEPQE